MKLFVLLLLVLSSSLQASSIRISPLGKSAVSNSDIINVQFSVDEEINFQQLQLKKIGDIFHILEIFPKTSDLANAKVMVMPPSDQDYDGTFELNDKKYNVEIVGFEFSIKEDTPLNNFITLDNLHSLKEKFNYNWLYLLLLLPLFLIIKNPLKKIINKRKAQKYYLKKCQEIKDTISNAKTRKDFENIYLMKNDIKKMFIVNDNSFKEFISELNKFQYRPDWSENELEQVRRSIETMQNDLREKSGI